MLGKIYQRLDLSTLSEALLYGSSPDDCDATDAAPEQRLKSAESELLELLGALLPDKQLSEEVQEALFDYQAKVNPVFFELGLRAGAALQRKLQEKAAA